jgi:hypothetical protein
MGNAGSHTMAGSDAAASGVREEIVCRAARYWLDEDLGFIRGRYFPGTLDDLETAKENVAAVIKLSKGKRLPMLIEFPPGYSGSSKEAREYYGSPEHRAVWRAVAFVGLSPVGVVTANIWSAIYGHREAPAKYFTSYEDAVRWLRGFAE